MTPDRFIQVAGIHGIDEALMIAQCGVGWIGFPLRLDINDEDMSDEEVKELIPLLPESVNPVLITYLDKAEEVLELAAYLDLHWVQLHGPIEVSEIEKLKSNSPEMVIIKSIIIGKFDFDTLMNIINDYSLFSDYFITDTYDETTGAIGATGKTHDWNQSKRIVEASPLPVILAGGLNPENVCSAIRQVRPFGVDVHSGVEDENEMKSRALLEKFVSEAMKGFESTGT